MTRDEISHVHGSVREIVLREICVVVPMFANNYEYFSQYAIHKPSIFSVKSD